MIDATTEERVLRRAVAEGFVRADELGPLDEQIREDASEMERWGPRLSAAIRSGLLGAALVQRLMDETRPDESFLDDESAEGTPRPGTGRTSSTERFQLGELIGEGGMAKVYKAYDVLLKRHVAFKFLKSDDPSRLSRFLREAQAQARVVHENVCKIHEVGELDGKPYIAMQLIEGQPLFVAGRLSEFSAPVEMGTGSTPTGSPTEDEVSQPSLLLAQMTVDQKARLMLKVAEGIHAAHREGLIHRDIKPSNIMIQATEDGDLKPYVLDFGLAREAASPGIATAGATLLGPPAGTPDFMAPEQARGESAALDRRTDVYGLGATLYALLAGRPPFEARSSLDVLVKVTEKEAPRLLNVPEDLATIVAKCLQKQPAQRYDSARALAEDLGRYLDGEPIQAHKTSLSYRLLKKARKHRKLLTAAAVAVLAFLGLTATSVRAQLRAQQRARLAGVFGQEVKAIESRMRIAHLAPEHDIRPEKAAIRQRMKAIEAQVESLGSVATGPGHYALGRGHLALQEHDLARKNLERAWNEGYREKEVAYALGQIMGVLYQHELETALRASDPRQREERKKRAEREYRDPALAYLQQSRGLDVESPEYIEALVAFCERRYPEALAKAQAASTRLPWLHEARGLEAGIRGVVAMDEAMHGQYEASAKTYREAEAAHRAAMEVGRSDPALPEGLCHLYSGMMVVEYYGRGGAVEPYFRNGLETCNRALRLDPDSASAHNAKASLLCRMAESELREGKDPRENLALAVDSGREAARLRPESATAYHSMGTALRLRFEWERAHGMDSLPALREAIRVLARAVELGPTSIVVNGLAMGHLNLGVHEWRHGEDPRTSWQKAEELYKRATELPPGYQDYNLNEVYSSWAGWELEHGHDPSVALEKALQSGQKALAVDPTNPLSLSAMATTHRLRAEFALAVGDDPRASVGKLVEHARVALKHNSRHAEARQQMAIAAWLLARFSWETRSDPRPLIHEGWQRVDDALEVDPLGLTRLVEARLALLEGRWRECHGLAPRAAMARVQHALGEALRINPEDADAYTLLAEMHWRLAQWQRGPPHQPGAGGQAAGSHLARGVAAAEKVLAIDPRHARALAIRGALYLEQVRHGGAPHLAARARQSLEQALTVNRFLSREYGPLLEQARKDAR